MSTFEVAGRLFLISALFIAMLAAIQIGSPGWAAMLGILFGTAVERLLMRAPRS